ncbi:MAG: DUF4199 domain-containing protein [Bacteroidetes bacterium]|nr:DUF4199 domain-containing protein [Bacteroidota bacterium]
MAEINAEVQTPLVRIAGRYGFYGSLVTMVAMVSLFYLHRHPYLIPWFFDIRIFLFALFIFFSIREFKNSNQNVLHFWQGIYIGLITYVLIAFLASIFIGIFAKWIEPAFVSEYIRLSIDNLYQHREAWIETLGEDRFNAVIKNLPSTTAGVLAFDYFLKSMPIGFILTLIISILLRRQPK